MTEKSEKRRPTWMRRIHIWLPVLLFPTFLSFTDDLLKWAFGIVWPTYVVGILIIPVGLICGSMAGRLMNAHHPLMGWPFMPRLSKKHPKLNRATLGYRQWSIQKGKLGSPYDDAIWPRYVPIQALCVEAKEIIGVSARGRPDELHRMADRIRQRQWIRDMQAADISVPPDPKAALDGHECGIYADTSPSALRYKESEEVAGLVAGWGRTAVHRRGWRAQTAYPQAFVLDGNDDDLARKMAEEYGVPVLKPAQVRKFVRRWKRAQAT